MTPSKILYGLALAWHFAWAATVATPSDWDPAYYLEVARHIARGDGAVTDAVWNLGFLPDSLRHPADLHWMPLPSRVLVPLVGRAGVGQEWPASQLCAVLIAAAWAPLGWAWAKRLQANDGLAWATGLICASAGGYVRTITTPDSIALYGLLGGAALLAASQRRAIAIPLAGLVAVTRGDGFLLAIACTIAWKGFEGSSVGVAGLIAAGAWAARCYLLAGDGWLALRERAANSVTLQQVLSAPAPPVPTLTERAAFLGGELGTIGAVWLVITVGVLALPAVVELYKRRADRGLWPLPAYALGFPLVIHLLAPAIAAEGSVYRSNSALFAPLSALAVVGVANLTKRYHPAFLPSLLVTATFAGSTMMGRAYMHVLTQLGDDCAALEQAGVPVGASVMSYDPIGVSARCEHPGVVMARGAPLGELAARYGIEWVLVAPAGYDNGTVRARDFDLPGFIQRNDRVFQRVR